MYVCVGGKKNMFDGLFIFQRVSTFWMQECFI